MAEIWGTPRRDYLIGTDDADLIRGGRGEDSVYGELGDDILYGGDGNDYISDHSGRSEIWGGRGSDEIHFSDGIAWGGWGRDTIEVNGGGWAVGGMGSDILTATKGALYGDQAPDVPPEQQIAGNDILLMTLENGSYIRAIGGLGSDRFQALLGGGPAWALIEDFTPGVDKLGVLGWPPDGESPYSLFWDRNHDGVMDELDGAQVDHAADTISISFGESLLVVHGATEIAASDWETDWLI